MPGVTLHFLSFLPLNPPFVCLPCLTVAVDLKCPSLSASPGSGCRGCCCRRGELLQAQFECTFATTRSSNRFTRAQSEVQGGPAGRE
jgi:hypothetical protein